MLITHENFSSFKFFYVLENIFIKIVINGKRILYFIFGSLVIKFIVT